MRKRNVGAGTEKRNMSLQATWIEKRYDRRKGQTAMNKQRRILAFAPADDASDGYRTYFLSLRRGWQWFFDGSFPVAQRFGLFALCADGGR